MILARSGSETSWIGSPWLIAGLVAAALLAQQLAAFRLGGWWADEMFAFWASDPSLSLAEAFRTRIAPDTNPPLFFTLLHVARSAGLGPQAATLAVNGAALAGVTALVVLTGLRRDLGLCAGLTLALFLLSSGTIIYLQEARSYMVALVLVLAASWFTLLALLRAEPPRFVWWVLIGMMSAATHLFAALACGALAAGLIIRGIVTREPLWREGLALGLSATIGLAAWLLLWRAFTTEGLFLISWIPFTADFVRQSALDAPGLAWGDARLWGLVLLVIGAGVGFDRAWALRCLLVFTVALAVFAIVPILASYKVPMVIGRYWAVGSALVLVPCAAVATRLLQEPDSAWPPRSVRVALLSIAGLITLAVATASGLMFHARSKPVWRGDDLVARHAAGCPPRSVRVLGFESGFAIASRLPAATFVHVLKDESLPDIAAVRCPILAWSEHYTLRFGEGFALSAPPEELLRIMKLDLPSTQVEIRRHLGGFVILDRRSTSRSTP